MSKEQAHCVIGIDEVGRGSLAGPVVVAAAVIPKNLGFRIKNLGKLKDSKKLTARQREAWFEYFKNQPSVRWSLAKVYPRVIERINISEAANRAATRAVRRLIFNFSAKGESASGGQLPIFNCRIFLDGGLYLNNSLNSKFYILQSAAREKLVRNVYFSRANRLMKRSFINSKTIVRGDEKITAIKIASIIAKVSRDQLMTRLAKKYPRYGLEIHKGYGTKKHFQAIKKYGPSNIHRLTFLKKCANVKQVAKSE